MAAGAGAVSMGCAKDLPVTNSAMARRSAAERRLAIEIMGPDSMAASTRSGDMACRASRVGARSAPASWQGAQLRWYMLAPSSAETKWADQSRSREIATERSGNVISAWILSCRTLLQRQPHVILRERGHPGA